VPKTMRRWLGAALTVIMLLSITIPPNVSANTEPVTLAKWDFSNVDNKLGVTTGITENLDKVLSATGATIGTSYVSGPTTGIQVPSATNWTSNPSFWKIAVTTKGYQAITLSSKQSGSNTGPKNFIVQYSTDDQTWIDIPNSSITVAGNWTSGVLTNLPLPIEANNQELIYVRWLKNSEASINNGIVASGGTSRIGLIEFQGEAIEPSTEPDPSVMPGEGKLVIGDDPLANVTFSLYSTGENQVWYDFTTDGDGDFKHQLPDGEYKIDGIWVSPIWYPLEKIVTVQNGLIEDLYAFHIDVLDYHIPTNPEQWNIFGTLMKGTKPLTNIPFSVQKLDDHSWYDTKSDVTGKFNFSLQDGVYQVAGIWDSITQKWYELNSTFTVENGKLVEGNLVQLDVTSASNLDNFSGKVTKGTKSLGNLVFSIRTTTDDVKWYDLKTDSKGYFQSHLVDGTYMIEGVWEESAGKWHVLEKEFTITGNYELNIDVLNGTPEVVNEAPVVKLPFSNVNVPVGIDVTIDLNTHFQDPEGANLTYTTSSGSIQGSVLKILTPTAGTFIVSVAADDGENKTSATFLLTVGTQSNTDKYYENAIGKTGAELKTALHHIIKGHVQLSYDQARDALKATDEDPNNKNNVILLYTNRSQAKSTFGSSGDAWNREHVWAKSHGDFGTTKGAGTDIHHLRPTDASVNSSRGHLDFDNGGISHPECTECKYDSDSWEPPNRVKGDIARMLMYMAVRYEGNGEIDLELADQVNTYPKPLHGKLSVLLEWNKLDPVEAFEMKRNETIQSYQKNRNPFIDHPEWADLIWGN
jgi:endonuclease I